MLNRNGGDKIHSTNYFDTFIEASEDSKAQAGTPPAEKGGKKTIAGLQYDLIARHPYQFSSDDVLFQVYADRQGFTPSQYKAERQAFFSKGQPCFRASPLAKTHGFGIHSNAEGKVALYGVETNQYKDFLDDQKIKKVKAMRNGKK